MTQGTSLAGSAMKLPVAWNVGRLALSAVLACLSSPVAGAPADDPFALERQRMIDEIAAIARETGPVTGRTTLSERVLAAMGKVERHRFVPPSETAAAYRNRPLPIGSGQTISQ